MQKRNDGDCIKRMKDEKKFRCFRCQELLDKDELKEGKGHSSHWLYCDHCYDHMFVNWNDVFNNEEKS